MHQILMPLFIFFFGITFCYHLRMFILILSRLLSFTQITKPPPLPLYIFHCSIKRKKNKKKTPSHLQSLENFLNSYLKNNFVFPEMDEKSIQILEIFQFFFFTSTDFATLPHLPNNRNHITRQLITWTWLILYYN